MKPVQHIVTVSGGKDSDCCYLLALERGVPFRAVMADTGNEHPLTYEHAQLLAQRTGGPEVEMVKADFSKQIAARRMFIARDVRTGRRNGKKIRWTNKAKRRALEHLHPSGNPYLDLCLWKGRFPSRRAQFCTEELKIFAVLDQVIFPALRNGPVLQWLGERAEESKRRADKPRFNRDDSGCYLWRPIKAWTWEDVVAMHRRHNLPMNPLYSQGMSRVGCMPCINCKKEELRQISVRFPEQIERIAEWEHKVALVSKIMSATFFAALTDPTDVDRPGTYSRIHQVTNWARSTRGGRNYNLLHEMEDTTSGCQSSYGLCE